MDEDKRSVCGEGDGGMGRKFPFLLPIPSIIHSSLQAGWSSLIEACRAGHEEVVRILLSSGADADLQDEVSLFMLYLINDMIMWGVGGM